MFFLKVNIIVHANSTEVGEMYTWQIKNVSGAQPVGEKEQALGAGWREIWSTRHRDLGRLDGPTDRSFCNYESVLVRVEFRCIINCVYSVTHEACHASLQLSLVMNNLYVSVCFYVA